MVETIQEIEKAIAGHYPIIYINSAEERRIVTLLQHHSKKYHGGLPVVTWSCTSGFDDESRDEALTDPAEALQRIVNQGNPGFFIMKDLLDFAGQPYVDRLLKDAYEKLRERNDLFIVIVSVDKAVPSALSKAVFQINVGLPSLKEMLIHLREFNESSVAGRLPDEFLKDISHSLMGLTLNDVTHIMHQLIKSEKASAAVLSDLINSHKKRLVASGGLTCLEYVPVDFSIEKIGGLDRLKEWILKRRKLFTQKAVLNGMPVPRGILIMGISGCGKSLSAKVVANTWRVPLFRLDMNLIFSQIESSPEAAFYRAIQTVENAAPAVLWIDEIENGLGLVGGEGTNQSQVFSAFLTWMQEKSPLIFVAATANQIESLPAELIRKGRFDQVFFCDLPNGDERAEILKIYIEANDQNPDDFDISNLTKLTKGWNAAEIELAVSGGRIDALNQNRAFTSKDIVKHTKMIVPLSATMKEQIDQIKDWAWDRATPASKGKGMEVSLDEEGDIFF